MGIATEQCFLSVLMMEKRDPATPRAVDSMAGKFNAEDHVSNSTWCGRKAQYRGEREQNLPTTG